LGKSAHIRIIPTTPSQSKPGFAIESRRIFARVKSPEIAGLVEWRFERAMSRSCGFKPPLRMGVNLTKITRFFLTVPELRLQPIFSPLREDRLKPNAFKGSHWIFAERPGTAEPQLGAFAL